MICVNSVTVYPKTITLKVGEWSYAAYAEVSPPDADCSQVRWRSNNSSVATVNAASGYIYANAEGTARIYALSTDGSECNDYLTVTVSNTVPVTSVTLNRLSLSVEEGRNGFLTATVLPDNATNTNVIWSSSDNSVATVSNGVITGIAKGYATITATAADGTGKSASCTVYVTEDVLVKTIDIEADTDTMVAGKSAFFHATVCPEDATNCCVAWSSDDPSVASVNPNSGLVYAKAVGTTTIYATACDGSRVCGCCTVRVVPVYVQDIIVCPETLTLAIGESSCLEATIYPVNATNPNPSWTSGECNIAEVDSNGRVTAKTAGTTYICANAQDGGGVRGCCEVTVYDPKKVTVLSCSPNGWLESSEIMGKDMAMAFNCENSYIVKTPNNVLTLKNCWNEAGECIIIHTHGSPDGLYDEGTNSTPIIASKTDIANFATNHAICFVMITACETAGGTTTDNVAYWVSKKINPNGIVIANTDVVSRGATSFRGINNKPTWKVYKNGVLQASVSDVTLTMQSAYAFYQSYKL